MSEIIICRGRKAEHPFKLVNPNVNIYTLEELCYYISDNILLVEKDVTSKELAAWISAQLGLKNLGHFLMKHSQNTAECVREILEYSQMIPSGEIKKLTDFISREAGLSGIEKELKLASYLADQGRFMQGVDIYIGLLQGNEKPDAEMESRILHNMGCICARLFLFDQASILFLKALEKAYSAETLKCLLCARRLSVSHEEYVDIVAHGGDDAYQASLLIEKELNNIGESDFVCSWLEEAFDENVCGIYKELDDIVSEKDIRKLIDEIKNKYIYYISKQN